ncbi:hypothetical protein DFH11DRAFT_1628956, partial [Phellopilus nigrolimitatus]
MQLQMLRVPYLLPSFSMTIVMIWPTRILYLLSFLSSSSIPHSCLSLHTLHICRPTHHRVYTLLVSAAFFLIVSSTHLYILQHSFHVYIYNTLTT